MNRKCELVTSGVYQVRAGQRSAVNKSFWKPHTEPQRPPSPVAAADAKLVRPSVRPSAPSSPNFSFVSAS